jgi:single-stranded-DNA-specific exonuclease
MGEGKHVRFTVEAGGVKARAVAFGTSKLPDEAADGVDATFGLELNHWQGSVEPRLVLRRAQAPTPAGITVIGEDDDWGDAVRAEAQAAPAVGWPAVAHSPADRDRRGGGSAGVIAGLVAAQEQVLVVVADVQARREALAARVGGYALTSWRALERDPGLAEAYDHVVALDPPPHPALLAPIRALTHLAWGEDELRFSLNVHEHLHALRSPLAAAYRALRDSGGDVATLVGPAGRPLHPVLTGRVLAVLSELGLVELDLARLRAPVVDGAGRRDLEDSAIFRACTARLAEGQRWLTSSSPARAA